ncbi:MAG: DUF975 family protein [Massilibacteroides sp.]|nr:DUF975 family protein [Massilibacteroides sp.]
MNPTFTIKETLSLAWTTVKSQIWVLVGLLIGYTIINFTLSLFTSLSFLGIIVLIVSTLISCIFFMGYLRNIFQALDGEEPQFSAYGQESRKVLKFFAAYVLFLLIVSIGIVFLLIPGIYLAIRLQFYATFIIDEDCGAIESLKRSWEITKGQVIPLLLLFLSMIGISLLGFILLGVGIFITIPITYAMYAIAYRNLNSPLKVLEEVEIVEQT